MADGEKTNMAMQDSYSYGRRFSKTPTAKEAAMSILRWLLLVGGIIFIAYTLEAI